MNDPRAAGKRSNAFLADMIAERLSQFRAHCLAEKDQESRAWWFQGEGTATPLRGHKVFGGSNSPLRVHLLDLYHGRSPTLINFRKIRTGPRVQIALRPFVILDSNAVSYLSDLLRGDLDPAKQVAVRDFLAFILREGLDPSPVFYLMESLARSESSRWQHYAAEFVSTVIDLQSLDKELFLRESRLASSLRARRELVSHHKMPDSKALVTKYLSAISPKVVDEECAQITRTYAALLKIMLLRNDSRDLPTYLEEIGDFMATRLGAVLGLERFAAILHWTAPEQFAHLLTPLQRGARADRALKRARSTAWDIYLGRLPEQLGRFIPMTESPDAEATCNLYYVATGDDALAEFLGHRSIEVLIQNADSSASSVVVGHRAGLLEELLTVQELSQLSDTTLEWERRAMESANGRTPVRGKALEAVVSGLEQEVREACS